MQEDAVMKNNQINVQGKIISELSFSHDVYGENFYNFKIEITRLSESSDILPITLSERLIDTNSLTIGSLVFVVGQVRSYNSFIQEENRNRLVLTIFARDIQLLETENKTINPNEVYLNGFICKAPVYRTTPFGREIADMLIAVNRSYGKSDYIPSIAWGRNARFASKIEVGNNIKAWGRMQSRSYSKKLDTGESIDKIAYEISISKLEILNKDDES